MTTSFHVETENGQKLEIIIKSTGDRIMLELQNETILSLGYGDQDSDKLCLSIYENKLDNCDLLLV
jgi:hypothetical protein